MEQNEIKMDGFNHLIPMYLSTYFISFLASYIKPVFSLKCAIQINVINFDVCLFKI